MRGSLSAQESKLAIVEVLVEGSCTVLGWRTCRICQFVEASKAAVAPGIVAGTEQVAAGIADVACKDLFASVAFAAQCFAAVDLHIEAAANIRIAAGVLAGNFAEGSQR